MQISTAGVLAELLLAQSTPTTTQPDWLHDVAPVAGVVVLSIVAVIAVIATARSKKRVRAPEVELDPLARLKTGLTKTRGFLAAVGQIFSRSIDKESMSALEDTLVQADMGIETSRKIVADVQRAYEEKKFTQQSELLAYLKKDLKSKLGGEHPRLNRSDKPPTVVMVCGVNGTGKTTSVAKLTRLLAKDGGKVLLAASDTFRAAAVDQLATWAQRLNVEIVKGQQGADPASVAHDACEKAVSRGFDTLIIDTAGRLHTEKNLMKELEKIARVVEKQLPGAPHEVLLVLDATTGTNAIRQAQEFAAAAKVTGIFLAKLDGTAKGGIVVAIRDQLKIPVKFVGLGEQPDDIEPFDADRFVEALFS
jgi:fused signal recognition particle receptor